MPDDFSNIKIEPLRLANNDTSKQWINMCKLLARVDYLDLPADYLEFINQFGEGEIGGLIKIYPIKKLIDRTKFWREDNSTKAEDAFFKKYDRDECTVIGETAHGDTLLYLNHQYYYSTRQYEEKIYELGSMLIEVFNFFETNDRYGRHKINTFVPFDSSNY